MNRLLIAAVAFLLFDSPTSADLPPAAKKQVDFTRDIQPIFAKNCLKCHGPDKQKSEFRLDQFDSILRGGNSGGPAILDKKSADSHLIQLVAETKKGEVMPPKGERLSANEVGLLRAWIDRGAKWHDGRMAADGPSKLTTDHWSFQPLKKVSPPQSKTEWGANSVDAFVLRKLEANRLKPSKEASRAALIRRLYHVMHGLAPTPKQIEEFVNDKQPKAWERLVERALKSPHYGERWARHWLDIVRFAESHGFETNRERPNAWPYRDYVIGALNEDKPYDVFIKEQIAGDTLGADTATGYLVGGAYDIVKGRVKELRAAQRQDELADMINTTGTAFLGLTLGCARCHNHKFDPVTQTDYYSLQAIFAGVNHSEREHITPEVTKQKAEAEGLRKGIPSLRARLEELKSKVPPQEVTGVVLIDDEMPPNSLPGIPGVKLLVEKNGNGLNPGGKQRGYKDDEGGIGRMHNLSKGKYTWWKQPKGTDLITYHPNAVGLSRIWISWGAGHASHVTDAKYLLDMDGDLKTKEDQQPLATVNQKNFSNGDKPDQGNVSLWSGLRYTGIHLLDPKSVIVLRAGNGSTTADVVVLQGVKDKEQDAKVAGAILPVLRPPVNAKLNTERFQPVEAKFVRFTIKATNSAQPCIDELEIFSPAKEGQPARNVALASLGSVPTASGTLPGYAIHQLKHINDGKVGNPHSWISNTSGGGWVQIEFPNPKRINRIVWGRDRTLRLRDRLATKYVIEAAVKKGEWKVIASSANRPDTGKNNGTDHLLNRLPPKFAKEAKALTKQIKDIEAKAKTIARGPMIYAGRFSQPGKTFRLYRGEPSQPREEVIPASLTVLDDTIRPLGLKDNTPERQRRAALAEWIASPKNPLTPRVLVNRLWHYHFGTGIVTTPSDFGGNGVKPTHPELLDWLAGEFIRSGWSLKHVHRLILNSSTWRQSSIPNKDAMAVDIGARYLWRFPPRRLEAEAIRDCILLAAGTLDQKMGGPGFNVFRVQMENVRHYFAKEVFGPAEWRRMIYMTKYRQEQDGVFGCFDCPDGNQVIPKRSRSTTPLQALNLLNSNFMMQQAEKFAARLKSESADKTASVTRAFLLAYGRKPDASELAGSVEFVEKNNLTAFCIALFNSNEFLFVL
jgi:mono/diheme cytochrome c family protein